MRTDRRADDVEGVDADCRPSRGTPRRWRRAACGRRWSPAPRSRLTTSCGRRSAPGAPCPPRPCTPCRAGRRARRRRRWQRRAGRRRFRPRRAWRRGACASSAWPSALLILCAPVCARSSRLSHTSAPQAFESLVAWVSAVGRPTQLASSPAQLGLEVRRVQMLLHCRLRASRRRQSGFGDVASAERSEAAACIGILSRQLVGQQLGRVVVLSCGSLGVHAISSRRGTRRGDELFDLERALDAGAGLRRRSTRRRRTDARGGSPSPTLLRVESAGENHLGAARDGRRLVPVGSLAAAAHRAFEQQRGAAARRPAAGRAASPAAR